VTSKPTGPLVGALRRQDFFQQSGRDPNNAEFLFEAGYDLLPQFPQSGILGRDKQTAGAIQNFRIRQMSCTERGGSSKVELSMNRPKLKRYLMTLYWN